MPLDDRLVEDLRAQFPALAREAAGRRAVFFDGPAGTQTPQSVIDAISDYLIRHNANHDGVFATSVESDARLQAAHQAAADFLGAADPETVMFGANMTTMTLALARTLARSWRPGDEIVLTRSEHDANFTPWRQAASDAGATVRYIDVNPADCTLCLDDFAEQLSERTRLVAVACASNASGTVHPVQQICAWARDVGATTFLDAVHYAPHRLVDVDAWGCDFLACSAYKFFGPHVGMLVGRRILLESLTPYKLRTSPESLPGRWMTGTQNHEGIAGTMAAVDYLADVGRKVVDDPALPRRAALEQSFVAISDYERRLSDRLLDGLAELPQFRVWGITDPARRGHRLPTVSVTHERVVARDIAVTLANQGIFTWHGNYYALPLTERLGVEPGGMVRIGLVHYNTCDEVDRLLSVLAGI